MCFFKMYTYFITKHFYQDYGDYGFIEIIAVPGLITYYNNVHLFISLH